MKNYYDILGVQPSASADEIKSAYRKLAMQHHPDRNQGDKTAELKIKEINEAYDTLKDTDRRARYDHMRAGFNNARQDPFGGQGPFTRQGPFGGHWQWDPRGGQGPNYDDIFNDIFRTSQRWQEPPRNRDINLNYQITLEEAFHGKETEIKYSLPNKPAQSIVIKIPAGIEDGTRIRYAGRGDNAIGGIPPGDLYISVTVIRHPVFLRQNRYTLVAPLKLNYIEAILGVSKELVTIDGSTIRVRVPRGAGHGQQLRVAGKGMKDPHNNRGDLMVELILIPPVLTDEQLEKLSEIFNQKPLDS